MAYACVGMCVHAFCAMYVVCYGIQEWEGSEFQPSLLACLVLGEVGCVCIAQWRGPHLGFGEVGCAQHRGGNCIPAFSK